MATLSPFTISIFILAFIFIPVSHSIPFIFLHGFGGHCGGRVQKFTKLLSNFSGSEGYCVEIGNGEWDSWFMPLEAQVEFACDKVKGMKELSGGYNIVGQSQGNLIARGVVEFCDGGPPIKNYISLAGPHAGTASVPFCGNSSLCTIVDNLIKSDIYSDFLQAHFAPCGYLKLPNDMNDYREKCKFLPYLNNELPDKRNATYKERFTSLQNLVLIMFEQDNVLIPKETSWFGYYPDGAFEPVIPAQQTKLYTEDWIGLKTLNDAGKVHFISIPGGHILISDEDEKTYVVPYLKN